MTMVLAASVAANAITYIPELTLWLPKYMGLSK